ncbi:protein phosphatase 2C domain-containing protein [Agrococcus versicolor]|uniref:Protein phosphatase 2C domain-containing protein n=1 Tax=Agrococcus versicolor TaxID=501482 RepID=A0ABP5MPE1_9MICO
MALAAARSHVGRVRSDNQDSGYAGAHLFVVADGMGGHAGGDVASALTVRRLREVDRPHDSPEEALDDLRDMIQSAGETLQTKMREHPELVGMGTTVSGIVRVGDRMAIAHIGDSRIYRYRVGALTQVTTDHTFVQKLVEAGRITREEAETHPRRNVVMRVLGNIETHPEVDGFIEDAQPGDRWLVCSDGLSGVVGETRLAQLLGQRRDAAATADRLVQEALSHGAPDNVTVVIVDVDESPASSVEPQTVGSAATEIDYAATEPEPAPMSLTQLLLHPIQAKQQPAYEHFEPESEEYLAELLAEHRRWKLRRRITWTVGVVLAVIVVVGGALGFYAWTQTRYFVGANDDGYVTIYQGVQSDVGPVVLSSEVQVTSIELADLTDFEQQRIEQTINADDLDAAQRIVDRLEVSSP